MAKTKRFIRSTEDAIAAPVGTIVLVSNDAREGRRYAAQKHSDGWYIASDWEGSSADKTIRGDVLVWGEVTSSRQIIDTNDAPAPAAEDTVEVVAYRDRVVQNLTAHATYLGRQSDIEDHIGGIRDAAKLIAEGMV